MEIGDTVWFQAYKSNEPIEGCIVKIGTANEVGCGFDPNDKRLFYVLESVRENNNFIFTKTTGRWLSKVKQSWEKQSLY